MRQSVFAIYRTGPDIMFPVPETGPNYGVHGTGKLTILIGKSGGGMLGKSYACERWYGEVRWSGEMLDSVEFAPIATCPINHIAAAREYVKIINENYYDGWVERINYWANDSFDLAYMQG